MNDVQFERWGDDLAIRLPDDVVQALDLAEGDEIDIAVTGPGKFVIQTGDGRAVEFHKVDNPAKDSARQA